MNGLTTVDEARTTNEIFTALAHERRRDALRVLDSLTRAEPAELSTYLAATAADEPPWEITEEAARKVQTTLEHVHLPIMEEAALIEREDGGVTTTSHPVLEDPMLDHVLEHEACDWDAILTSLADEHRRIVLGTLVRTDGPTDWTTLATEVAGHADATVEEVLVTLHHVHLPKLEDAGLAASDADARTATYDGDTALDEEWLVADQDDTPPTVS
jgi:DNA-binding transcriptional ArsR family regulator